MRTSILLVSLLAVGCGSPLVGEWRSDKKVGNGEDNVMFVLTDGSGTAEVYAAPEGLQGDAAAYQRFDFELSWVEDGEAFELDMECDDGPCDGNDFKMDCEVIRLEDDREKLDCDADGNWKNYVFNWERHQ